CVLEGKGVWNSARNVYIDCNDAPRNDTPIALDEAHTIRSIESANCKAVGAVKAHSRWALTGTPVANGLMDLWLLICLLQTKDSLDHCDTFRSLCPTPLQQKKRPRAYGLRRTKSLDFIQLKMPTMTARRIAAATKDGGGRHKYTIRAEFDNQATAGGDDPYTHCNDL
ncbi:hypothetical protein BZA05DRAFT_412641, partial [Tricharina praecox]|uniref:uncharacterized protein n=1 Tax=Tricharina praecox TaxID=43433 RepID=UPI00221F0316